MLEWILTVGAAELTKVGLEQLLKLGQTAAENYVKDFFKGCLKEGVAAKPEVAKKAVASVLKAFLLLVRRATRSIDAGRLTQVLTDYLKQQGFSDSREKANLLIDQLRSRNFILCDRDGDIYSFVHCTFLE